MYIKEVHVHTEIHYNFVNVKKSDMYTAEI